MLVTIATLHVYELVDLQNRDIILISQKSSRRIFSVEKENNFDAVYKMSRIWHDRAAVTPLTLVLKINFVKVRTGLLLCALMIYAQ